MKDFRELRIWEKSHHLTLAVYQETRTYPKEELYGLTSQTRRAASSVPTNIAEGCGRGTDPDFARFLQIAMGSAKELNYHLLLARDLGMLAADVYDGLVQSVTEVKRMLAALIRTVNPDR
jgi:four helix bundle protein